MVKIITLAAAATLVAALHAPSAGAQSIFVPEGDIVVCHVACEGHVVVVGGDLDGDGADDELNAGASGDASFQSTTTQEEQDAGTATFTPVSITISGTDPLYGSYTFTFDASRPVASTTITSNTPGVEFPATADVYANVTGTIEGLPGVFTNNTPCHMRNANLMTFNPQQNELYQFVNAVTFSDASNPNGPSFTIPANASVTLQ